MFYSFFGKGIARNLRERQTKAEKVFWKYIRNRKFMNLKFRRQYPITFERNTFIVDFYCHKLKLIIEIDGPIHLNPGVRKKDQERQKFLEAMGFRVIRFQNEGVLTNIKNVLKRLRCEIPSPHTPRGPPGSGSEGR